MQTCPHCGQSNAEGETYCYRCGHILPAALPGVTATTTQLEDVYESLEPRRRWGTAYFDQQARLQLTFRDTGESVTLQITSDLVLGRAHNEPGIPQPDVDLLPYGAHEKGVSRRHLVLQRDHDTITVTDLNSSNRTYLNGQMLLADEPRILRDNDELRLGHLVIRVEYV